MSESQQASTPEPEIAGHTWQSGVDWCAKHWPRIRMGHEGMMLESAQRGLRIREVAARNSMTGDNASVEGWPGHKGDDAMGVNIGDHIHYHQAAPPPATEPVASTPTTTEEPSLLSKALPWVVAAGLGIGGYMLGNKPTTTTQPQTQPQVESPQTQPQSAMDKYGIKLEHYVPGVPIP